MSTSPSEPAMAGMAAATPPLTIDARYFDGRSTRVAAVRLTLNGETLHVTGDGIERSDSITTLRVSEAMGTAPRLISFPDGTHCEVRDHAGLAAMLAVTHYREGLVVRLQRSWRWAFSAVVVTVAAVFAGYIWGLPAVSEWIAWQLPEKALSELGKRSLQVFDNRVFQPSKLPAARQKELTDALARLAPPATISGGAGAGYTLLFRNAPAIGANAMALPDGSIVLTDQLVALAAHDEEILAVLTHELGHLNRRHSLRMMVQGSIVGFVVSWYIGDVSSVAAGIPTFLLQARYSRGFEHEADAFGAAMLKANGMSPGRLADMLEKLEAAHRDKISGKKSGPGDGTQAQDKAQNKDSGWGDYVASHPATRERIDALNKM